MGKRGLSATTIVLVAVLVGALFMVGKTVIPPPPGPPEPPPPQKDMGSQMVVSKDKMGAEMKAKMMAEMEKQKRQKYLQTNRRSEKKFDPNQIEIKPAWNHEREMGDKGNEEMEKMVTAAKAAQKTNPAPAPPTPMKASQ